MIMAKSKEQEIPEGYKQTEIGVIPEDWDDKPVGDLFKFKNGLNKAKGFFGYGSPIVNYMDVYRNRGLHTKDIHGRVSVDAQELKAFGVKRGDVFFTRTSETVDEIGFTSVLLDDLQNGVFSGFILRARPKNTDLEDQYKKYCFSPSIVRKQIREKSTYTTRALTNGKVLSGVKIFCPPHKEQLMIASALSDIDSLILKLEILIEKKKNIKQGAMQVLLTGKKRLSGFDGAWKAKRIADIASLSTDKNGTGAPLPVLTCSKHLGFVDSLSYFKNQVFSSDTKGYKVIRRGQIGYPSNHIEEGSIGLQDLYDVALVSPIYIIFSASEGINSYFLHRLLKLDSYKREFQKATTSSVDRRGSLRWPAFSEITVILPEVEEQNAIAAMFINMDAEIEKLESQLKKYRNIKQGMMQNLLTGKIRLIKK